MRANKKGLCAYTGTGKRGGTKIKLIHSFVHSCSSSSSYEEEAGYIGDGGASHLTSRGHLIR